MPSLPVGTKPDGADVPASVSSGDVRGLNSFNRFLIGMTRDVPRELRRVATVRAAIRRHGR